MKPHINYKRIGPMNKRQAIASAGIEICWHTAALFCVAPYYCWAKPLKKDGLDE